MHSMYPSLLEVLVEDRTNDLRADAYRVRRPPRRRDGTPRPGLRGTLGARLLRLGMGLARGSAGSPEPQPPGSAAKGA
jgi:hypothetical protein